MIRLTSVPHDGIIRYFTFFNRERLIVYSPKALADIHTTECYSFQKPAFLANQMRVILGNGLLLSEGVDHKVQKKGLMPAFTRRRIDALYPLFLSKVQETVHAMTASINNINNGGGKDMEITNWASRYALDVIGVAALGNDFGAIQDDANPLVKTYNAVFKVSKQQRIIFLLNSFLPWWLLNNLPLKHNRDFSGASDLVRAVCRNIITEKRVKFASTQKINADVDVDILSTAIQSGRFTDEGLIDQAMTFLAAGHETTESSIVWAIYMLSRDQTLQQQLREEIRQSLPSIDSWNANAQISSAEINRLPLLQAICSETLRFFTPVRLTMREATQDTYLQGVSIPRGTKVMISSCATNTDRTLWGPDAAEFNPYRWVRSNSDGKLETVPAGGASNNYALLTFSQGPRSCIGQGFARAEFACLLAGLIGRFEFRLKDEALMDLANVEVGDGITAKPKNGLRVVVRAVPGF